MDNCLHFSFLIHMQLAIEIPVLVLALIFGVITYPTVDYYWSAYKCFWYIFTMLSTLLYSSFLGMLMFQHNSDPLFRLRDSREGMKIDS
ncbi:hypothetical protein EJ110_NYTH15621 [Nymphaea thermarum]|nr:hypothetical protein EJ110_NYTH15621 [Nymphaea thermarum]